MPQHYDQTLVLVSLLVAILASYTALRLALHIRSASGMEAPAWLLGGGFVMGIGIWAMHFVGMQALTLPIEIAYDGATTLLSLAIAVAISTFALRMASRRSVGRPTLAAASIAMGIGICSMFYVGMAAIEITPPIRYDAYWVAASLAIAFAASFAALWVVFARQENAWWWRYRIVVGAIVMGFAIFGMHYAGMAAARFPAQAMSSPTSVVNRTLLAGAVTMITLFVLLGTLLLLLLEARAEAHRVRIQASLAEATESSRAKDEFLAMLGHELRNPLASIANAVYLLDRAEGRSGEWQFARDVIARQSSHLARMVEDLLDVGRAITGKMTVSLQALDLHQAVDSALRALRTAGKTKGRHVEYQGETSWVQADRTRIEQVVTNLVANAVQHTDAGGRISLRLAQEGGEVVLTVADDGAGMDGETAARVFELFFQAQQEPHRGRGGLGIGLTLARRIVELHGGTISVMSDGLGSGATFTVRLPVVAAPGAGNQALQREGGRAGRRIVIVEDASDARVTLQRVLEQEGHSVRAAVDGVTGLAMILELKPDVALIDIGLPGLDGYAIVERLRAAGVATYLVALTGYGRSEDRERARRAGFDMHLTKPASMERLLKLVAEAGTGA